MKMIVIWVLILLCLGLGVTWYFTSAGRNNAAELKRVHELETEQDGADSAALRSLLVTTAPEQVKAELAKKTAALRDSANDLRDDIELIYGSVTPTQEREIDHLRRHAAELESLANRTVDRTIPDEARLELYRRVVMTYGAGSYVTRQMRREIALPRR